MATATELADWLDKHIVGLSCPQWSEAVAELRRIPDIEQRLADAEKRALNDIDIGQISLAADRLVELNCGVLGSGLRHIVNRLRPQPIAWRDCGEGSIAEFGGWTLMTAPVYRESEARTDYSWVCARGGRNQRLCDNVGHEQTIDAAKSAAEDWVRKQVAK